MVSPQDFVVHTRRGKPKTRGFGKSFRYKPATDEYIIIPIVSQRMDFNIELTSLDNLDFQVSGFTQWQVVSPGKILEQVKFQVGENTLQEASEWLRDLLEVSIRRQLSTINLTKIFYNKNTLMKQIGDELASLLEPVGLSVESFIFQTLEAKSCAVMEDIQAPARDAIRKAIEASRLEAEREISQNQIVFWEEKSNNEYETRRRILEKERKLIETALSNQQISRKLQNNALLDIPGSRQGDDARPDSPSQESEPVSGPLSGPPKNVTDKLSTV